MAGNTDWSFNPTTPIQINHTIGEPLPSAITIVTQIKDYREQDTSLDYDYYVQHQVGSPVGSLSLPNMITLTGVINNATGDGYLLTNTNTDDVDVIVNFQNLNTAPEGDYSTVIGFSIYRKNIETSVIELYDVRFFNVETAILNGDPFLIEPSDVTLAYIKNVGTSGPQTLSVTATGSFTIAVKSYITLSGGNLVDNGLISNTDVREYTGSGTQNININANSLLNDFTAGYFNSLLRYNNGVFFKTIAIQAIVFDTDDAVITPSSFNFTAIKGFQEADSQEMSIVSPYAITVTYPLWLTVSPSSGNYNITSAVQPVASSALNEGVYSGDIIVTANNVIYIIPVTHTVYSSVQLGMNQNEINFTEDFNTITKFYHEAEYKIKLTLVVNYYKYNSDTVHTKELTYKLALFNNKTEFFVGRTLNNIMSELEELSSIQLETLANILPADGNVFLRPYYKPAEVNLQVDFIHLNDENLNATINYEDIFFLKGRKPLKTFPNTAVLNFYAEPLRVTPNSIALFILLYFSAVPP